MQTATLRYVSFGDTDSAGSSEERLWGPLPGGQLGSLSPIAEPHGRLSVHPRSQTLNALVLGVWVNAPSFCHTFEINYVKYF